MDTKELAAKIVDILDSKKGIDIETIDLTGKTVLADYFVLASGNSTTQIKSLADEVEYVLKKDYDITPDHIEGRSGDKWILLVHRLLRMAGKGNQQRECRDPVWMLLQLS